MGRLTGFEPATSGTTNRRSNQLSYNRHKPVPRGGVRLLRKPVKRRLRRRAPVAQQAEIEKGNVAMQAPYATMLRDLAAAFARAKTKPMTSPGETSRERLLAWPGVRQVPSARIELFFVPEFLPGALCDDLTQLIELNRRPSTIADPNGDDYFRTSETCDLEADEPAVRDLEARLFALNGIPFEYGEPVQGQRYEPGQEFKGHTDYFEPTGVDFHRFTHVAGQRTWTFMAYLNDVEAGGATRFKVIDKTFQPRKGMLVAWNNHRPDGSLNAATLHHAMKVRKGLKYVITKWYREKPWG
jgi:prolyl 4-hydroxylase